MDDHAYNESWEEEQVIKRTLDNALRSLNKAVEQANEALHGTHGIMASLLEYELYLKREMELIEKRLETSDEPQHKPF